MSTQHLPPLDDPALDHTRDALHAYSRVLGAWLTAFRKKRKHWWHASLRPSLKGLTTGVVHGGVEFELELNLIENQLQAHTSSGDELVEALRGQPAVELAYNIKHFLIARGVDVHIAPGDGQPGEEAAGAAGYSAECAHTLARVWSAVSRALTEFRAGIREETSPIQLWPHHFDLSMLWLPGDKVPGQDPENEEYADKQLNFGFTLGDQLISEPYFYITAYPLPEAFPDHHLPAGTTWYAEGFSGAVLPYRSLLENEDPSGYLLDLWNGLLCAGRRHMTANT